MFREELRAATDRVHRRLHDHPILAALGAPQISIENYRLALAGFHGIFAPIERIFERWPEARLRSARTPLAAADLRDVAGPEAYRYLDCQAEDLPEMADSNRVLGAMFVLDRIQRADHRALSDMVDHLDLVPPAGCRFLSGHGIDAAAERSRIDALIDFRAENPRARRRMLDGAVLTYDAVERWLDRLDGDGRRNAA